MTKVTAFKSLRTKYEGALHAKVQMLTKAEQDLMEAKKLYNQGNDKASLAADKASAAALPLYKMQIDGVLTKDETSALLGKVFGFKAKKDGTASKTPNDQGEAIRKRIVRAVDAKLFAEGKIDRPAYLDNERPDPEVAQDVAGMLNEMEDGKRSIWTVYVDLAALKDRVTVPIAYDASKLIKLISQLKHPDAAAYIAKSPSLMSVYAELEAVIEQVGETIAAIETDEDHDAAAGGDKIAA